MGWLEPLLLSALPYWLEIRNLFPLFQLAYNSLQYEIQCLPFRSIPKRGKMKIFRLHIHHMSTQFRTNKIIILERRISRNKTIDLTKLIIWSGATLKLLSSPIKQSIFLSKALVKKIESSKKNKWDKKGQFLWSLILDNITLWITSWILCDNTSWTRRKRLRDRGSHWLIPLWCLMGYDGSPLVRIRKEIVLTHW